MDKKCTICGTLLSKNQKRFCSSLCQCKSGWKPPSRKGIGWSKEQRIYMSKLMKGREIVWAEKISKALIGNTNSKGKRKSKEAIDKIRGDKNKNWKGENVSYAGIHKWVKRAFGNPVECAHCTLKGVKLGRNWNIQWANKSRRYTRDLKDWIALCVKCHAKYDNVSEKMKLRWKNQYSSFDKN